MNDISTQDITDEFEDFLAVEFGSARPHLLDPVVEEGQAHLLVDVQKSRDATNTELI